MAGRSHFKSTAQIFAPVLFVLLLFLGGVIPGQSQSARDTTPKQNAEALAQAIPNAPTGARRCMFCHPAEVEGYARSAMAHSLRRAGQEPEGLVSAHGSTIAMRSSATGYFQRWENGGDSSDYRVDYVVGSGNHASGYLVEIGRHLFQSPVAFYTSRKSYDLAPGYENVPDPDFTRPVSEECVLCHSGTALHVSGTLNQYREPIFSAEAITCERCHGPVGRHLADPRAGTIVNPAKLEPAARDSVCEQCHLFGAARVPNPGKKLSDFMPGQRLEDTFTIYRNAVPPGRPAGAFKVISHVEQLAQSACARNSGGRLWCGTCHDPHEEPPQAQAVEYYRARCLTCHTASFPAAAHPGRDTDCLSCHMPRRNAQDGGHTVFTDHRIQRRPETTQANLPADAGIAAWREPAPELQKRNLGIAYIDVGMQRHSSQFIIQGYRALTEVQRQFMNDSDFFKWIGEALLVGKQTSDAKFALERALQLDPDSPVTEAGAAAPYIQEGDAPPAIAHLERAVTLDPLYLPAASTLINLYQKEGKTAEAAELSSRISAAMNKASSGREGAESAPPEAAQKKAEDVFKNIRMLKGVPAEEVVPSMEFISSSLGVECSFCHVEDHFEKDDKKPKQKARDMMQMMFALNKNNFESHREVTCYSCHRGARDPIGTPLVDGEVRAIESADMPKLPTNLPTVSQLLENYVRAAGGAAAIESITSRIAKGSENFRGQSTSIEVFTQAPNRQAVVRHYREGDSVTVFDGHAAWFSRPGRAAREMHGANLDSMRLDADLHFPLHIRQYYSELRIEFPEKIGGHENYVVACAQEGRPSAKLYFDEQSSLLVRVVRYKESALGVNPEQIDFSDYRDVRGLQVPFRVTISEPTRKSTIQLDEVHENVPVDDAKFSRPPS
jgi:photosynthetic reaction center cytochrome c subunit